MLTSVGVSVGLSGSTTTSMATSSGSESSASSFETVKVMSVASPNDGADSLRFRPPKPPLFRGSEEKEKSVKKV